MDRCEIPLNCGGHVVTYVTKVLIIEDHAITRDGLASALSRYADIVITGVASTCAEGLLLANGDKPDLILLDLHLPDTDSPRQLVQSIKSAFNVPVVAFSAETRTVIIKAVLDAHADAFVYKAASADVVYKAITDVLAGKVGNVYALPSDDEGPRLSPGDRHILSLLARGKKYQDIAKIRFTESETVRKQVEALQGKLRLKSREELIAWSVEKGYGALELDV